LNLNANVSSDAYTRIDALKYHLSVSRVSLYMYEQAHGNDE